MTRSGALITICKSENGMFCCWNPDEICMLRNQYRIVGFLGGSSPHEPYVPKRHGLPLVLTPYEVCLLHELQLIRVIDNSISSSMLSNSNVSSVDRVAQAQKENEDWLFAEFIPQIRRDPVYCVFKDLWQRGYVLTAASKFGGHFLVYSGNPEHCHASFIVRVVAWDAPLSPYYDLIAFGRLAVTVNKAPVFASVCPSSFTFTTTTSTNTSNNNNNNNNNNNATLNFATNEYTIRYVTLDWQGIT
jgi:tRNA splicing endonuclease